MCQGGDFTRRNGAGGESIYGATFADESFARKHDTHGLMSMANRGPNTQSSQFFITTRPTPHLDGKHVVFGRVVSGFNIVETMENEPVDSNDRPLHNVMIANCGELVLQLPPGVKLKQQQQEKASESESDVDSASDSEQEEKKRKRKRKRSADFSDSEADESDKQKREEEEFDYSKKKRKHKKHHKSSSKKHRKHKKHHKKSRYSSDDEITKKEEIKEEKEQEQSRYQEYKDRVSEKPEWEQRRRFDDDPNVKFKGRGHVKYRAGGSNTNSSFGRIRRY